MRHGEPWSAGSGTPAPAGGGEPGGGSGAAPLVLLPGNMCDERLWTSVAPSLREHGHAVRHADLARQSSISEMAEAVLADLPEGQFVAIGFSMGAIVALEVARLVPDRLAGLVLIALNASADLPERSTARPGQQQRVAAGELARVVADELRPHYFAAANRHDADLLRLIMQMALDLGPAVFIRQSEALRTRPDLRPVLRRLAVPTLLLCGAEDALCPPEWHHAWAERIGARARLEIIEGAGHLLPLERPVQTSEALLGWLTGTRKS
jgi:pimeloyl-ACP methyl ester carboxylesterase